MAQAPIHLLFDDHRRPYLISLALHGFFFFLAAWWQIGFDFKPAEFVEISLAGGSLGSSPAPAPATSQPPAATLSPVKVTEPVKRTTSSPPAAARPTAKPAVKSNQSASHPVMPPKRRMLEQEDAELSSRPEGKLTPESSAQPPNVRDDAPASKQPGTVIDPLASRPGTSTAGSSTAASSSSSNLDSNGSGQPFAIEGDAAQRTILHQVIPEYPNDLQKEEVLKIRFTLLADGRIGLMIPMRKGDPVLERITMEALRQWRFNALPATAEQKNMTGIITFRYELQ
jgi:outer membrane biosynthesis protein TonB